MFKIRTYNQIAAKGLNLFNRDKFDVSSEISQPQAFILRSQKLHNEAIPEHLEAVARAGAGTNNIPTEEYSKKGIVVFNTPGANANAVKELVFAGMLLSSRGIYEGISFVNQIDAEHHQGLGKYLEAQKKQFAGNELKGRTLGVVGLGAIGASVANLALELGMKVIGYDPALSVDAAWRLSSKIKKAENIQSLLSNSDYITLHIPAIKATHHLINSDTLSYVKKDAVILNFAREEIVDTDAICTALNQQLIKKFVTDFPSETLLQQTGCLLMPHIGASTSEAEENCAVMASEQLIDFLENGNIQNSTNFPAINLERNGKYRITFVNENVPKVLGQVLSLLADKNINVLDMLNKSRENIAYNILDIEQAPSPELINAIENVDHVLRVRSI